MLIDQSGRSESSAAGVVTGMTGRVTQEGRGGGDLFSHLYADIPGHHSLSNSISFFLWDVYLLLFFLRYNKSFH